MVLAAGDCAGVQVNWFWRMFRPQVTVNPPRADEMFGRDGFHRHGQMIGVISIIENGYLLSCGSGHGEIMSMYYAKDEADVGEKLRLFSATKELKK